MENTYLSWEESDDRFHHDELDEERFRREMCADDQVQFERFVAEIEPAPEPASPKRAPRMQMDLFNDREAF